MLSTSHQFLFIHIPKTAGNSIQDALRSYSEDRFVTLGSHQDGVERFELRSARYRTTKHSTLEEYASEYETSLMQGLFKFTCVRNPWLRCMSHYFSPHRGEVAWDRAAFLEFVASEVRPIAHYLRPRPGASLADAAQTLDAIVRHESLHRDMDAVCRSIGIAPVQLPRRNASHRPGHEHLYDDETIRLIGTLFAEEVDFFGYRFP